ncbi:PKD domain-containing protein [Luteibaculum oceani]|nr:PKD domain-containing protein [Luteibaculum oceani]
MPTGIQYLSNQKVEARIHQDSEPCMFDKLRNQKLQDPQYREDMMKFERLIQKRVHLLRDKQKTGQKADVYTIPIVFHIYHTGQDTGVGHNIPDAQVQSAVDALNRDFRRLATDGGIAQGAGPDIEVEFCLATVDPNGDPTTGIIRVNATGTGDYENVGIDEDVNGLQLKALSKWPTADYINVWVVREINDQGEFGEWNGGTLGYAYPVSGSSSTNPNTNPSFNPGDGIVVVNFSFGNDPNMSQGWNIYSSFRTNNTLTHEMGHHLNLLHPFNDDSCSETDCSTQGDFVCDTPPTTLNSNCNSPACSGTQLVENYMDYTGEDCANMFTEGQKLRMRAVLEGFSRSSLTSSVGCNSTFATANFQADKTEVGLGETVTFTDISTGLPALNSWTWDFGDGNTSDQQNPTHSYTSGGFKTVTLTVSNGTNTDVEIKSDYILVNDEASGTLGGICDTLRNYTESELENLTYYVSGGDYVPAVNGGTFQGFAEKFQNSGDYVFQDFIIALGLIVDDGAPSNVNFVVYEEAGNGAPGNQLISGAVPLSALTENSFNRISLPSPVEVTGNFFVGFEFEPTTDTMTVFCSQFRDNGYNTVFYQSGGGWGVFADPAYFSMALATIPYTEMDFSIEEENQMFDFCTNEELSFGASSTYNITSYQWEFQTGNPQSSVDPNPSVSFSGGGEKTVALTATGRCGGDTLRQVSLFGYEYPDLATTIVDSDCAEENGSITVTHNGADQISFNWIDQSNQTNKLEGVAPGQYVLESTNGPCSRLDTFEIEEINTMLANDTVIIHPRCEKNNGQIAIYMLDAGNYTYQWTGAQSVNNDSLINLGPGNYGVEVRLENNCLVAQESFVLENIGETPNVGIDAPDTVELGASFNVSGQFPSEGEHNWSFSDGQDEQTGTQISVTFNDLGDIIIRLLVENAFGCVDSAQKTIHVKQVTGIIENKIAGLSIFPNPAGSKIYISAKIQLAKFKLLDALGREIESTTVEGDKATLDVSGIAMGSYLLVVESTKGFISSRRIVISR